MSGDVGPFAAHQSKEIQEIRAVVHALSERASVIAAELTYAEDHLPQDATPDVREAVRSAAAEAVINSELVRQLQRLVR
jgi:hypothetical protein